MSDFEHDIDLVGKNSGKWKYTINRSWKGYIYQVGSYGLSIRSLALTLFYKTKRTLTNWYEMSYRTFISRIIDKEHDGTFELCYTLLNCKTINKLKSPI